MLNVNILPLWKSDSDKYNNFEGRERVYLNYNFYFFVCSLSWGILQKWRNLHHQRWYSFMSVSFTGEWDCWKTSLCLYYFLHLLSNTTLKRIIFTRENFHLYMTQPVCLIPYILSHVSHQHLTALNMLLWRLHASHEENIFSSCLNLWCILV